MYIYIYIYIYICMYVYMYIYIYTHAYIHMHLTNVYVHTSPRQGAGNPLVWDLAFTAMRAVCPEDQSSARAISAASRSSRVQPIAITARQKPMIAAKPSQSLWP